MIDELLSERWKSEEKEILESVDDKIASIRISNVIDKITREKVPRRKCQANQALDFPLEE